MERGGGGACPPTCPVHPQGGRGGGAAPRARPLGPAGDMPTAVARRLQRRNGIAVVIVDYLQLIEPEDKSAPSFS